MPKGGAYLVGPMAGKQFRRHCQVADERAFFSLGAERPSLGQQGTRNLIPLTERTGPQETVVSCPEQVTSDPERFWTTPCTEANRCRWAADLNLRICRSRWRG